MRTYAAASPRTDQGGPTLARRKGSYSAALKPNV
jgi:hypothetical protein